MSAPANEPDPTASTQQFQAFVERGEQEPPRSARNTVTKVTVIVLVAVLVASMAATLL